MTVKEGEINKFDKKSFINIDFYILLCLNLLLNPFLLRILSANLQVIKNKIISIWISLFNLG